ncbi:TPA: 30S ribosomal protein S20 [Candidatus Dependentiae bacterium]|nr:MAG: 30S ribosomal protein S20 [candidate division TM6 bacterium GW2011_GWF2_43_87]HBL98611.1 30S ribosomal protein S20 [Candidatus Dependentiae bacterium]
MANTKSAKKNIRKSEKRRLINSARTSALKTAIKKVHVALANGESKDAMDLLLKDVTQKASRAKSKGVIHSNAASRRVGRVAKKVAAATRATA